MIHTVKKVNINCRWYYSCPLFTHFKSIKHWCLNSLLWMFLFWLKTSASDANTIYHQLKSPSVNVWHHLPINSVIWIFQTHGLFVYFCVTTCIIIYLALTAINKKLSSDWCYSFLLEVGHPRFHVLYLF